MYHPSLDDYRWLTSADAARTLRQLATESRSLVALTRKLRQLLSPERAHLILELIELRRRAHDKFERSARMFFTEVGLQQATDEVIAGYKAERFPRGEAVADLCCGVGGDLLSLGRRGPVVGVDQDPVTVLLARANSRSLKLESFEIRCSDAREIDVVEFAAWHIDPDRRASRSRNTHPNDFHPSSDEISDLLKTNDQAAVKLAPATYAPEAWHQQGELEWIGSRGECRQQVAWFGDLARHPGRRVATVVHPDREPGILIGDPNVPIPLANGVGAYVYEPAPPVLAAQLTGALAELHGLQGIAPSVAYLTGDERIEDPLLGGFEVTHCLPFDLKKVKAVLDAEKIARVEVKKRHAPPDTDEVRRALRDRSRGTGKATLLLTTINQRVMAILSQRFVGGENS